MEVNPNTKVVPFVTVGVAPKPRKATSNDSPYDFEHFESFAGPNTSESEFCTTVYDLRRAGSDVDAFVDRNGKYDRQRGVWINRNRTEMTTKELAARFSK
jgi:hypothetical protein